MATPPGPEERLILYPGGADITGVTKVYKMGARNP